MVKQEKTPEKSWNISLIGILAPSLLTVAHTYPVQTNLANRLLPLPPILAFHWLTCNNDTPLSLLWLFVIGGCWDRLYFIGCKLSPFPFSLSPASHWLTHTETNPPFSRASMWLVDVGERFNLIGCKLPANKAPPLFPNPCISLASSHRSHAPFPSTSMWLMDGGKVNSHWL